MHLRVAGLGSMLSSLRATARAAKEGLKEVTGYHSDDTEISDLRRALYGLWADNGDALSLQSRGECQRTKSPSTQPGFAALKDCISDLSCAD